MSESKVFFKQAATVFSGAVIGNGLLILFLPIVTSFYSVESFGIYGFLLVTISTFGPLATGKMEQAIVVADPADTFPLLILALTFLTVLVCFISALLFLLEGLAFNNNLLIAELYDNSGLFILAIFLYGLQIILEGIANRNSNYRAISIGRILTPILFLCLALIFPNGDYSTFDLIVAFAIAPVLSVVFLLRSTLNSIKLDGEISLSRIVSVSIVHRKFWAISSPTSFLDNLAASSPIYLLGILHTPQLVAFYTLAIRIGYGPLSMIARSLSQVNLRTMSRIYNSGSRPIGLLKKLMQPYLLGIVLIIFVMVTAKDLIIVIFGEEWEMSGQILQILFPAFFFKFFVSSFSTTLEATGFIILASVWKLLAIITIPIGVYLLNLFFDPIGLFKGLAALELVLYGLYLAMILFAASQSKYLLEQEDS